MNSALLPAKYKKTIEIIDFCGKLNLAIYLISMFVMYKKANFVKSNELSNKLMIVSGIWYFSFVMINWKLNGLYSDSYETLASSYSEREMIKMINKYSKFTKIFV